MRLQNLWQRVENVAVYWYWAWNDWRTHSAIVQNL